ncbi:MAG TPA: septum formation initiator [Porphyromonadaceae bacterium]|nr:septum formation initiator [Porphyromonadaceae bacterium]
MKKFLKTIQLLFQFLRKHSNIYIIEVAIFIVMIFITDRYSLFHRKKTREKIENIELDIAKLKKEKEIYKEGLEEIEKGGKHLEKFAREHYLMKKPNEEIFIIRED